MAIKLGGDTNITLINTSFTVVDGGYPPMVVPLFTAASAGNYHFEGDLLDSGNIAVSISINSTPKEIWSYYDGVTHHVTYEFTLAVGDIVTLEAAGNGTGSNLTVIRYADEPKEIFVGEGTLVYDYSAMQGPAPDGFHVPLNTEWQAVYDIWTALGGGSSDGTNFGIALKLPFAGDRGLSAGVSGQGSYVSYWSSSRSSTNGAHTLDFNPTALNPQNASSRAYGCSVRCFKDAPTIPTSSWTKLYGTSIEAGGIFWSSTDGLISMSSDGTTWITIADKNLGATTVWNSGDTLSEANCGGYFQRGNNYMFPFTGTVTTSSTLVDASNYGPGNYYNSSTFITRSDSPYRWDTTDNGNLWGGETGVVIKHIGNVKEVYVGTTKVRPSGGGGYKTYAELTAMTLSNAITELNTDAQGYYNNLNEDGHIIGIGIANSDKSTYQCWGESPIIYWNGSWRNGEIIIVKVKADSSGNLMIPKGGVATSGAVNAAYNWWVSYDGGSETQYSGTGNAGSITIASGLTADTEHTIVIRPNSESYLWARAFGFKDSGVQGLLTEVVYDGSYIGYGSSSTSTGGYFRIHQYNGCTSLTTTHREVLPNTVTTIDTNFRSQQYNGCTGLTSVKQEIVPSTVTSIGNNFRYFQYSGCTGLTSAPQEVLPNSVTSIGNYFRYNQYNGCSSLTSAAQEALSSSITSIGTYFRGYQYRNCTSLTTASQEILPSGVTDIGSYFRYYQYNLCTALTTAPQEVLPNTVTTIGTYFRADQYLKCSSLTSAPQEVLPNGVTSIDGNFRASQYNGCTSLTKAPQEALPSSLTYIGTYFRSNQYAGCTNLAEVQGMIDLSIGNSNYRNYQFYNCNTMKTIKVLSDVGYGGTSTTLSDSYVSTVSVPSAYLQNFIDSTLYPRHSIINSKFVGY